MFDALTHLYTLPEPASAIAAAQAAGVHDLLLAGVSPEGWEKQSALAGPGVHLAYGIHPWTAHTPAMLSALEAALSELSAPVAIGEIGLDGSRRHRHRRHEQEVAFRAQLAIARAARLPVILHVVRAHGTALACIDAIRPVGGIVHGFSGSAEVAGEWIRRGFLLSFGARVCAEGENRAKIAARLTPADQLLVETDAPDQLPESQLLRQVLAGLSSARDQPAAVLAAQTAANAHRLLRPAR